MVIPYQYSQLYLALSVETTSLGLPEPLGLHDLIYILLSIRRLLHALD
jgi:hypothetical protein